MSYHNTIRIAGEPGMSFRARQMGRTVAEQAAVESSCAYSALAAGVFNRADLDADVARIAAEVEACGVFAERQADDHSCERGPLCGDAEREGYCEHTSCAAIYFAEFRGCCGGCQSADFVVCPDHGYTTVLESGSGGGFAGGRIYWAELACGCTDVDESADVRAAI